MIDLDQMVVPLEALEPESPQELRDELLEALREAAAQRLPGLSIELDYVEAEQRFTFYAFVKITEANLEHARTLCEVELGEELGFDLWWLNTEAASFLRVEPPQWARFRSAAERAVRATIARRRDHRALAAFERWAAEHPPEGRRPAWHPEVEPVSLAQTTTFEVSASYYGGPAWLEPDAPWPACPACARPMELLLHLDPFHTPLADADAPPYELFQCTECGEGRLARAVPGDAELRPSPLDDLHCRPKHIVGWRAVDDYPSFGRAAAQHEAAVARRGDKLGGWPARLQGTRDEPFACPECGAETTIVYQLDSDSHAEHTWGDGGRLWLHVCPRHREHPQVSWECS